MEIKGLVGIFSVLVVALFFGHAFAAPTYPDSTMRRSLILDLAREMERLDGEGLSVRQNRSQSWKAVVENLANDAERANDYSELIRVFQRLDQAYPNTHSYVEIGDGYEDFERSGIVPEIRFDTEWLAPQSTQIRISEVGNPSSMPLPDQPQVGDEVLAINGRSISVWLDENFEYCKWPVREQCDVLFFWHFRREALSWDRSQSLSYTIKRGSRVWNIPVAIKPSKGRQRNPDDWLCYKDLTRYPGFALAYKGSRACVFQKDDDPSTAVLRITSFQYRQLLPDEKIRSVQQEINSIYPWWLKNATWKHLIIDVIDNGGGKAPIPYYQILFTRPFQEQWTQLKKNPELLDVKLREGVFWGEPAQEFWFQNLLRTGKWDLVPNLDYLPRFPMFCVDDNKPCDEGLFQPKEHPFRGRVSILLNQFCVSSCDGFVYAVKEQLGEKVRLIGQPQAADTAYSRLTINVSLNAEDQRGYTLKVVPIRQESSKKAFIAQTVSVTRSVDAEGRIQSGVPLPLDLFVPLTFENTSTWVRSALSAALQD